jgi:hypothetical protein
VDQAKPELVDASALKPIPCNSFALPASHGFGSTKQPLSCSFRNSAHFCFVEIGIVFLPAKIVLSFVGRRMPPKVHETGGARKRQSQRGFFTEQRHPIHCAVWHEGPLMQQSAVDSAAQKLA